MKTIKELIEEQKTVNANVDKVYKSGKLALIKNSKYMNGVKIGSPVVVNDCSPVEHDLIVSVKATGDLLNASSFSSGSQSLGGVTFTNNGDGSISASGTASGYDYAYLAIVSNLYLEAGDYVLSGCAEGAVWNGDISNSNYLLTLEDASYNFNVIDSGDGAQFTIPEGYENTPFTITIRIFPNVTVNNVVFKPQIKSMKPVADLNGISVTMVDAFGKDRMLTSNSDGIVEGFKSSYPNFTLSTAANGITIQCDYYRDIDRYIDNKLAESAMQTALVINTINADLASLTDVDE